MEAFPFGSSLTNGKQDSWAGWMEEGNALILKPKKCWWNTGPHYCHFILLEGDFLPLKTNSWKSGEPLKSPHKPQVLFWCRSPSSTCGLNEMNYRLGFHRHFNLQNLVLMCIKWQRQRYEFVRWKCDITLASLAKFEQRFLFSYPTEEIKWRYTIWWINWRLGADMIWIYKIMSGYRWGILYKTAPYETQLKPEGTDFG